MCIRRLLRHLGFGYFIFDGAESTLWRAAAWTVPFSYRWLGRSLSIADVDSQLTDFSDWQELRVSIRAGDRICPFEINRNTMAMRRGFVVLRRGNPIGGVVTISS